ncbi:MAG: 1-deoxy-D-xylulose-5-phosphate reductoisomerase [Candidatus Aminicenantes bacterium]|nr:1-deoxy-D-xylulose-5-phosphate reductoisomerase [Acidobacteriota bacterium]MCG2810955.1 1-deoxy-D-xylulose-5-phosphate reductoisomerase [Candidatus Aminicenantes bacterium]
MIKNIVLLGSTGSIGRNVLAVLRENQEHFRLIAMAAGSNTQLLEKQIREFSPQAVSVKSQKHARELQEKFPQKKIFYGEEGLQEIVSLPPVDCVIAAISGTDGLPAAVQAIRLKRRLCLANKETMVVAGDLINREITASGAEIIPIDSEQSAIFQCLAASPRRHVRRVMLTASGGPFFRDKHRDFAHIRVEEALAHPTWSMGKKITIDSATLMNKALEIIEARHLFDLNPEQIDVLIHPQSIVHSMVEFVDSAILAQLGIPDMKLPILYSLSYPERVNSHWPNLDLAQQQPLEFFKVDNLHFPSIAMAYDVLKQGQNAGAVFNTANETAVEYFLANKITFKDIFAVVGHMLSEWDFRPVQTLADVQETISLCRIKTVEHIENEVLK